MKVKNKKGEEHNPTEDEKKDRRIMLALSWLSVESEMGAPSEHFVHNDLDTKNSRRSNWKTVDTLKEILKARGVSDTDAELWVTDCTSSLNAAIRDEAVWVNRSKAFDAIKNNNSFTQDDIWDFLSPFFSGPEAYLKPIKTEDGEEDNESEGLTGKNEKVKDLLTPA